MTTTANIVNRKWSMDMIRFAIFYLLLTLFAAPTFAAFEDTGTGARATSLAGAYVALGDDIPSLMYNPASLARISRPEIASEYSRLFTGLSDGSSIGQFFMGYGQPLKVGGTVAFGWKQFNVSDLYTERTLSLGYGRWITPRWAAGAAIKQLHESFSVPNIIVDDAGNVQSGTPAIFAQNGNSQNAISADMGVLYRLTDRYTAGVSVQDVNEPDMALSSTDQDHIPRTIRTGLAYQGSRGLSVTTGLNIWKSSCCQQDFKGMAGVEKWWTAPVYGEWAARGGMAFGTRELRQFSMGFGYRFTSFRIDYAFMFNMSGVVIGDTAGTHRFSIAYRFGSNEPSGSVIKSAAENSPQLTIPPEAVEPLPTTVHNR